MVKKVIGVVDHGSANLASLGNALERISANFNFVSNPDKLEAYDAYILPGVGAFAHGMGSLEASGMSAVLLDVVRQGKNVLGICLGMQFLFDDSEEGNYHKGLGIISGNVKRINTKILIYQTIISPYCFLFYIHYIQLLEIVKTY